MTDWIFSSLILEIWGSAECVQSYDLACFASSSNSIIKPEWVLCQ
jgi:hypothetical protein